MNLINCPGCAQPVSPEAKACPKCGHTIKQEQSATGALAAIIIGLILAFVVIRAFTM